MSCPNSAAPKCCAPPKKPCPPPTPVCTLPATKTFTCPADECPKKEEQPCPCPPKEETCVALGNAKPEPTCGGGGAPAPAASSGGKCGGNNNDNSCEVQPLSMGGSGSCGK